MNRLTAPDSTYKLPDDARAQVISVCSPRPLIPVYKSTSLTTPQEARKEGVFAGLSSGLASGEHYFVNGIGWNPNCLCFRQLS